MMYLKTPERDGDYWAVKIHPTQRQYKDPVILLKKNLPQLGFSDAGVVIARWRVRVRLGRVTRITGVPKFKLRESARVLHATRLLADVSVKGTIIGSVWAYVQPDAPWKGDVIRLSEGWWNFRDDLRAMGIGFRTCYGRMFRKRWIDYIQREVIDNQKLGS